MVWKKRKKGNKHYQKGYRFEWECMWYLIYNGFDNVRSYASKGICDIRSIPPRSCSIQTALGVQCKDQQTEDYLNPKERAKLLGLSLQYHYLVVLFFKSNHKVYVKVKPWELDNGVIMPPEEFLRKFYGMKGALTWKEYKERQRNNTNIVKKSKDE